MLLAGLIMLAGHIRNALKNPVLGLTCILQRGLLFHTAMLIYQFIPGVFTGVSLITMFYLQNLLCMPASIAGDMISCTLTCEWHS